MKKALLAGLLLMGACSPSFALSWGDFIRNSEGGVFDFTLLNSVTPSYFYNAASGRSEVGATSSIGWIGNFLSADFGYSVPNAEDKNTGTVILGGNIHVDKLITFAFPDTVGTIKSFIPEETRKFWDALSIGTYVGIDTGNQELAAGIYSGLTLKF